MFPTLLTRVQIAPLTSRNMHESGPLQHDWLMFLTLVILWLFVAMSNFDVTEFPYRFDYLVSLFI